ncbi:hypothetical protein FFK22_028385 [Mycobacterium sp. KBS0706]|uniref:YeeE/YedE family protein n=1 Tax=Mycobacterium sp. KBS0706 TaxID=2578109 RepID=UPI00110FAD19|nr:hypothetical protein FFK22_028385 [Mycobacterium sp. KBS0706]
MCTEPLGIGSLADSGDHGSLLLLVAPGLLVGFGTRMGSGCTSGHGVAGLARLSPRSIVAVATSLATGIATATLMRWGGLP